MEALYDISILCWNIRGAHNNNARRQLKDMIRKYRPTFLAIMETHVPYARLTSFWTNNNYTPVHVVEASGHSGGIWLLQYSRTSFTTTVADANQYSITFTVSYSDVSTSCTCIYASPNPTLRPNFWNYLINLQNTITGSWMLIGDFNETLLPSDQRGGIFNHSRAASFAEFMEKCNLLDLSTTGGRFTWHRNHNGLRILSKKLDRGLANVTWRLAFPEAFVEVLCRLHSDHNPLLLRFGGLPLARGPRPFRFEAAWIDHEDYSEVVDRAWKSANHNPVLALTNVRENSITFNQETFGNIFKRKKHIERRLRGIQNYLERVDSTRHVILEKELQHQYNHILFQEEMLWYQKSREQWVKFGDKNSSFFHAQTIIRRKKNKVHRIQLPNGIWTTDSVILQEEAQKIFKNLFTNNQPNQNRTLNEGTHPTIDDFGSFELTCPITKEEVTAALNSMKPYKAPGPDGFQCIFFKQYWHIVGDDIFHLVKIAFSTGYFDPNISNTLISLIPKVEPTKTYKDFRPISLCNIVYKIITKVLVHRLRPILEKIIGPFQSSFLPGRGTSDNAIVLQEIIHFMRRSKKKKGYVAFKLDLEKAFDNVNWDFLENCLHDFGFPEITIRLIMHCVTSPTYSILWNGNQMPQFKPTHGLRQGDPLSPYLFIICMEKLSISINNAVLQKTWDPVHISKFGPKLSHLLFADDVLLFTKAKNSQIKFMTELFERFSHASGLKINLSKSRAFYSSGTPRDKINRLTSLSGIRNTTSLEKYLGFPILKGRAKKSDFLFIIEKMQSRLASWKNKLLNKPGRLALASSVLSSIPNYYMQIAWLPQSICDGIDQTTRNFIWRDSNNKGTHLVSWKKISRPKNLGGLGLRPARDANICLLGKLVWDLLQSTNKLWVNVFTYRYTTGFKILQACDQQSGSPTWSSIIRAKEILKEGFSWRAGSGSSSFWFCPWSALGFLCKLVPYIDIHDMQLTVSDVISSNEPHSNILYSHLPQTALDIINNTNLTFNASIEDAFIWHNNKNGVYTTKSGYDWLLSRKEQVPSHPHTWAWLWKLQAPEKLKFLFWLACHDAVPTLTTLHRRNIAPSPNCPRCGHQEETFLHCVRDCYYSKCVWTSMGFTYSGFFDTTSVHSWLKNGCFSPNNFTFTAGVWWVWRHRNLMCLNDETWSTVRLSFNIRSMVENLKACFPSSSNDDTSSRTVKWNSSNFPGYILNTDGSCIGSPTRAGFGCVIRNNAGLYIAGASGHITGSTDILLAELSAIFHGLNLATSLGINELFCYTDSLLSINLIQGHFPRYHVYAVLIQNIKEIIQQGNITICHTLREGNQCADYLAKLGASSNDALLTHDSPPDGLRNLLNIDAAGTLFHRG
ncbi:ribonuclease H [Trifolium pratense]|uniref:Ribonuclease H n=1 Tax=Trifolium pratense TaxID=57577 RepID=A0A2K3NRD5_TRIPR|nr:ribonuclease H [Trifolium pratense]